MKIGDNGCRQSSKKLCLQKQILMRELDDIHSKWSVFITCSSSNWLPGLPACNFHHLVKIGNECLFDTGAQGSSMIRQKNAKEACTYYQKAISMESNFTMVAHYNLACCLITTGKGKKSISELKETKRKLDVYKTEVSTLIQLQCSASNVPEIHI